MDSQKSIVYEILFYFKGELIGGNFGKALPLAIFGISSVMAGLLCLFLPETLNQKLPDTVEEAIHFKGYVNIIFCVFLLLKNLIISELVYLLPVPI